MVGRELYQAEELTIRGINWKDALVLRKWLQYVRVLFSEFHLFLDVEYGLAVSEVHSFHIIQLIAVLVSLVPNDHEQISFEDVPRPLVGFSLHAQPNSDAATDLLQRDLNRDVVQPQGIGVGSLHYLQEQLSLIVDFHQLMQISIILASIAVKIHCVFGSVAFCYDLFDQLAEAVVYRNELVRIAQGIFNGIHQEAHLISAGFHEFREGNLFVAVFLE